MTTSTTFNEALHPRGQAGNAGQFRTKTNSAPAGGLTGLDTTTVWTPETVQTPEYSLDVLTERLRARISSGDITVEDHDPEDTILQWEQHGGHGETYLRRVHLDERGNVYAAQEEFNGNWFDTDPHGDKIGEYQGIINQARLEEAGISIGNVATDGGYSGNKFVGAHARPYRYPDATDVARHVRADLKKAVEWGALPGNVDIRVSRRKFAGGQSIDIAVEGLKDSELYTDRVSGFGRSKSGRAREVEKTIQSIAEQWNTDDSDSMTDYFNVSYYTHIDLRDEGTAAWHAQQRDIARRRRAELKAAKEAGV